MGDATRIDELRAPPVAGKFYLVPTVRGLWYRQIRNWPIIGTLHEDTKFFGFDRLHYHLDRRFLDEGWRVVRAETAPLTAKSNYGSDVPLGPIVYRRLECRRANLEFPYTEQSPVIKLQQSLAGTYCRRNNAGWVCPHRGFSLGSVAADLTGVITCPMHGLQIHIDDGKVIGSHA